MVENRGNTSAYVGGGGHLSLPSAEGVTYKPHAPQPPPRKAVINLPGRPSGRGHRTTCSSCGVEQADPAELVKGVCAECRATAETKFTPEHELPPIAPELLHPSEATHEGEPADDTEAAGPAAAPSSRPAPSAEHDGYEWPTNSIGQPIPPPPQAPRPVPAWHHEALQLLIATEGHPDPAVKAARKVVANGLVALAKAHRATTTAATTPTSVRELARGITRRRRSHTSVDVAQVVELYADGEGLSPPEIGRRLGHTAKTIRHALDVGGVQRIDGRTTHSGGRKKTADDDDPVVVEKLRALYVDQEWSLEQIAGAVDGSVKLVSNMLRRAGVQLRPSASAAVARERGPVTDAERAEICRRYQAGEEGPAIAGHLGVSRQTIYASLRAAGVAVRPRGGTRRYINV